jgi:hypothetical protein
VRLPGQTSIWNQWKHHTVSAKQDQAPAPLALAQVHSPRGHFVTDPLWKPNPAARPQSADVLPAPGPDVVRPVGHCEQSLYVSRTLYVPATHCVAVRMLLLKPKPSCVTQALKLRKPRVPSPLSVHHFALLGYDALLLDATMPCGHDLQCPDNTDRQLPSCCACSVLLGWNCEVCY